MENYSKKQLWSLVVAIICILGTGTPCLAQVAVPVTAVSSPYDVMSMPAIGNEQILPQTGGFAGGTNAAYSAAVADGITTGIGISAGAIEMNPLVVPSPLGVMAMTGLKIGLIKYADTLPEQDKRTALKTGSAIWSGAAVNNLLVLAAAPTPFSILAGILMGVATWKYMDGQYQEQDRLAALQATQPLPVVVAPPTIPDAKSGSIDVAAVEARGEMSSGE